MTNRNYEMIFRSNDYCASLFAAIDGILGAINNAEAMIDNDEYVNIIELQKLYSEADDILKKIGESISTLKFYINSAKPLQADIDKSISKMHRNSFLTYSTLRDYINSGVSVVAGTTLPNIVIRMRNTGCDTWIQNNLELNVRIYNEDLLEETNSKFLIISPDLSTGDVATFMAPLGTLVPFKRGVYYVEYSLKDLTDNTVIHTYKQYGLNVKVGNL